MSKILMFLADGFEEIEGLTVVDLCRRAGIAIDTVTVSGNKEITGGHKISVMADLCFDDVDLQTYDMVILPGGGAGTKALKESETVRRLTKESYDTGKYVAAICAAPTVLGDLGILSDKRACCYAGMEKELNCREVSYDRVTVDGKVITSRGMGTAMDFGLMIIEILKGKACAKDVAQSIML